MKTRESLSRKKLFGKRILSVDYGTKVTGLAICQVDIDPFPQPLDRIIYKNDQQLSLDIQKFVENECADYLLLGVPHYTDGKTSKMTEKVLDFGQLLDSLNPDTPLLFQDETLTTYAAKERMQGSPLYNFKVDPKKIDQVSAAIILEDFLSQLSS